MSTYLQDVVNSVTAWTLVIVAFFRYAAVVRPADDSGATPSLTTTTPVSVFHVAAATWIELLVVNCPILFAGETAKPVNGTTPAGENGTETISTCFSVGSRY